MLLIDVYFLKKFLGDRLQQDGIMVASQHLCCCAVCGFKRCKETMFALNPKIVSIFFLNQFDTFLFSQVAKLFIVQGRRISLKPQQTLLNN
jgi:hypothetical protein